MVVAAVADWLGGRAVLRGEPRSVLDLVRAVEAGLPVGVADAVVERGKLAPQELYRLVIPRRTLTHRRARGGRLSRDESDKLARVARVMAQAEETMGDEAKAHRWARRPNRALGGALPIELLETEQGARAVEDVLGRLGHGAHS